jgi:hypothetical protein
MAGKKDLRFKISDLRFEIGREPRLYTALEAEGFGLAEIDE